MQPSGRSALTTRLAASKVRYVVQRFAVAGLCVLLSLARAERSGWAADPPSSSEPRSLSTRGPWYGWQTLIVDTTFIAVFLGGSAGSTTGRRMIAGGILGYVLATPIIHLAHDRPAPAVVSALARLLAPLIAYGFCDGLSDIGSPPRVRLQGNEPSADAVPPGFYRRMDNALGRDFGIGTVCAGLAVATMSTLDAAFLAYEPKPSSAHSVTLLPRLVLDLRRTPSVGFGAVVSGEF